VRQLPGDQPTVMYAPNCPGAAEWDNLWVRIKDLPVNFIIKNATYAVEPGAPTPPHYARILKTVDRTEQEAIASKRPHTIVTPRDLNICKLFPHVAMVISTKSSVLAEFLPFGVSVEVDMPWPSEIYSALISRDYSDIVVLAKEELYRTLSSAGALREFLDQHPVMVHQKEALCRFPNRDVSAGQRAAGVISDFLAGSERQSWTQKVYAALGK